MVACVGVTSLAACEEGGVRVVSPAPSAPGAPPAQAPLVAVDEPGTVVVTGPRTEVTTTAGRVLTIVDLRALARQRAWAELVEHLSDVPPAARDREWQSLAQTACLEEVNHERLKSPLAALGLGEALLQLYPALAESREFMNARADLGLQAFERCFEQDRTSEGCAAHLRAFVRADPTASDLAFKLGKLVPPRAHGRLAVPAFAVALRTPDDPRCNDPDVKRAVLSGLSVPRAGNEALLGESVELASNVCWRALAPAITDRMGGDSTDYLRNVCPFVRTRGALTRLMSSTCDAVLHDPPRP